MSGPLRDLDAEGSVPSAQRRCYCVEGSGKRLCWESSMPVGTMGSRESKLYNQSCGFSVPYECVEIRQAKFDTKELNREKIANFPPFNFPPAAGPSWLADGEEWF